MRIAIEDASEGFAREVLALAARQDAHLSVRTVESGWTAERAERCLSSLPAGAGLFAQLVIDGDGRAEAETLRAALGRLTGPTVALSRAVPRGARAGWRPQGTPPPIERVDDPDHPSWQKAAAYAMSRDLVPVFREALSRLKARTTGRPDAPAQTERPSPQQLPTHGPERDGRREEAEA